LRAQGKEGQWALTEGSNKGGRSRRLTENSTWGKHSEKKTERKTGSNEIVRGEKKCALTGPRREGGFESEKAWLGEG